MNFHEELCFHFHKCNLTRFLLKRWAAPGVSQKAGVRIAKINWHLIWWLISVDARKTCNNLFTFLVGKIWYTRIFWRYAAKILGQLASLIVSSNMWHFWRHMNCTYCIGVKISICIYIMLENKGYENQNLSKLLI